MALFFRLFDGVLTAACYMGAFGGQEGKTFDTYLDIVNSYCIPENKTFCPFLFPLQYARAMSSGAVRKAQLADQGLRGDLLKIRREIARPILLLIDEGDVLAKSRVHLQKLRNVFMNT